MADYYTKLLKRYGPTPEGVDWNSNEGQRARFDRLYSILGMATKSSFSLLDYGSGYGAFASYLMGAYAKVKYFGFDISVPMVTQGQALFEEIEGIKFSAKFPGDQSFTFVVASGLFNVSLSNATDVWQEYVDETLHRMWKRCTEGMAFNFLSNGDHLTRKSEDLYYEDPARVASFVRDNFSPFFSIDHVYSPWEFTVAVMKETT